MTKAIAKKVQQALLAPSFGEVAKKRKARKASLQVRRGTWRRA